MKIGIGVPNPVPGTPGTTFATWARRAEERGFSGLSTIDRVVYPSFDSLLTLAAAAGATERIELVTNILLAPAYTPVLLAKATASLDQLSNGRLTLGLAPGGRPDDYTATGRDFHTRGRDLDATLDLLHRAWRGDDVAGVEKPVGPRPVNEGRVPVLVGGTSDAALRRVTTWGVGWTAGGAAPEQAAQFVERVRTAWAEAGRHGEPRLAALVYFSLGDDAEQDSRAYLRDYYAFLGPYADQIAEGALRSEQTLRDAVRAFTEAGITELYFDPTTAALNQVDRLAEAVL